MKKIQPLIISIAAIIFGIVFIASGIHSIATKDLFDSTVTATIVDKEEHWESNGPDDSNMVTTYYIDYEIDGVKYEHVESPEQSGNMQIGDKIEILYQSQNPEKISAKNIASTAVIFIVAGSLVAVGGCIFTVRAVVKSR